MGATRIESIDKADYEEATILHDMNQPVPDQLKGSFSLVFESGTLEHVFNFPQSIKNCMEMVRVGGHFVGITIANNLMGHGFYQFSPELYYRVLSPEMGSRWKGCGSPKRREVLNGIALRIPSLSVTAWS